MQKNDFNLLLENLNINNDKLIEIAIETGFIKRKRLIYPLDFLSAVCTESAIGTASYNDIAAHIDADSGLCVSRQAIWKKVTTPCEDYFKKVLALIITSKTNTYFIKTLKTQFKYKRILVQDSTIIRLPTALFSEFSGVANGQTKVCNARVQCVYDLISEQFVSFSVDPYSKNDLTAAPEIILEQDDLVLRDRGYLMLDEIQRHIDNNAHCIYRYKFNMVLKDQLTEKQIDLFSILKKEKCLDMKIMLNNKAKTIVRLLAYPVSKEVADNRRMKAKKENKKSPSKEYLESLSWSIYITTITDENIDYAFIYEAYSLRWRIEIIFKCWKSNMGFAKIHNVSSIQLKVWLLARFIMIIICAQLIFIHCRLIVNAAFNKDLSLLKLTNYLLRNTIKIANIMEEINNFEQKPGRCIMALAKFCTYDKRNRRNYQQKIDDLFR